MNALMTLLLAVAPADAPKYDPDAHAKAVAPYVESRTFGILRVDLTRLDADALSKSVTPIMGRDAAGKMRDELARAAELSKHGAHDVYIVFSLAHTPLEPFLVLPAKGDDVKKLANALRKRPGVNIDSIVEVKEGVLLGDPETIKRVQAQEPQARPEIARAFATAGPGFLQLVLVPTTDLPRIVEDLMPKFPPELGGGSTKILTRGLKSIALSLDAKPALQVNLTIQAADADSAKELNGLFLLAVKAATTQAEGNAWLKEFKRLADLVKPKIEGDRLTINLDEATLVKALEQPADKVRMAAARAQSSNNLKQLGLAMHSYHETHKHFPAPASLSADKGGVPRLSWRVHILPFIDQDALYKEFKLNEAWDSEHNKKLIEKMPAVFRSTTNEKLIKAGKTTYVAPLGKSTMWPGGRGIKATDVTDGLSNTIFLIDVDDENAVIWTRPDDLEVAEKNPMKALSTRHGAGTLVLFGDGSVRFLAEKIDQKMLWAMFTRNGGEVIKE